MAVGDQFQMPLIFTFQPRSRRHDWMASLPWIHGPESNTAAYLDLGHQTQMSISG